VKGQRVRALRAAHKYGFQVPVALGRYGGVRRRGRVNG
jgi:hypothetical protein